MNSFNFAAFVLICLINCGYTQNRECQRGIAVCVRISECPPLLNLLRQKNLTILRESNCGYDGYIPFVCCPLEVNLMTTTPRPFTQTKPPDDESIIDVTNHPLLRLLPYNCGALNEDDRIFNGKNAGLSEFPWMAALIYLSSEGFDFRCGGTLLNSRYVLTAAHCMVHLNGYQLVGVRLGEHDWGSEKDCENDVCAPPVQDISIERIFPHPQYSRKTQLHDIGLIKLARNAFINDAVRPICLPIGIREQSKNLEGQKVTVVGWGRTESGIKSQVLQKVSLPVTPLERCAQIYNRSVEIRSTHLCAGGTDEKRDSCSGDSGGPLQALVQKSGQVVYTQYGIVSSGPKNCGTPGWPGVYTRIGNYMNWILNTIRF